MQHHAASSATSRSVMVWGCPTRRPAKSHKSETLFLMVRCLGLPESVPGHGSQTFAVTASQRLCCVCRFLELLHTVRRCTAPSDHSVSQEDKGTKAMQMNSRQPAVPSLKHDNRFLPETTSLYPNLTNHRVMTLASWAMRASLSAQPAPRELASGHQNAQCRLSELLCFRPEFRG